MAGSSVAETTRLGTGPFHCINLTATGDDADGTMPATAVVHNFSGRLLSLKTNPGSTAPTANYDITLVDQDGHDVLEGVGLNRHTSSTEKVPVVFSGTAIHPTVDITDTLTLTIANTSVNDATIEIYLYIYTGSAAM